MSATRTATTNKKSSVNGKQGCSSQHHATSSSIPPSLTTERPRHSKRTAPLPASAIHFDGGEVDFKQVKRESLKKHNIEDLQCSYEYGSAEYFDCARARVALWEHATYGRKRTAGKYDFLPFEPTRQRASCPFCPGKTRPDLNRHLRTHLCTGHQPYQCKYPQCITYNGCAQRGSMDSHLRFHESKLHLCPLEICGRYFIDPESLETHMQTTHEAASSSTNFGGAMAEGTQNGPNQITTDAKGKGRAQASPSPPHRSPTAVVGPAPTLFPGRELPPLPIMPAMSAFPWAPSTSPFFRSPLVRNASLLTLAYSRSTSSRSRPSGSSSPPTPPAPAPEVDDELVGTIYERRNEDFIAQYQNAWPQSYGSHDPATRYSEESNYSEPVWYWDAAATSPLPHLGSMWDADRQ
ncbi:hypothetical protein BDW22DRAFT_330235 [Trametopsis cervina]|nr:hypothetical protein BDW22DRAFT_330235 [Trametopsis cervina]